MDEKYEAICLQCGKCCYLKSKDRDGTLSISNKPCKYLLANNKCSIYDKRHEINPDCLTMEKAILNKMQPTSCPYVKNIEGYRGPKELMELNNKPLKGILEILDGFKDEINKKTENFVLNLKERYSGNKKKEESKKRQETTLNVEIVQKTKIKGSNQFSYLTAIKGLGNTLIPIGKTYNTETDEPVGSFLKIGFINLNKYTDPSTKENWYEMWNPIILEKSKSLDNISVVEKMVNKTNGERKEKSFPSIYLTLNVEDNRIEEFHELCIQENSEEFDFALSNGWIKEKKCVPKTLFSNNLIRNREGYILRKDNLVVLRNKDNKIEREIFVGLYNG